MKVRRPRRPRPLKDAETERQLEVMFGIGDGTESEDGLEDSDTEMNLEDILSTDNTAFLETEFADSLLMPRCTRRRGKHGPEEATSEWEEYEENEEISDDDKRENENDQVYNVSQTSQRPETPAPVAMLHSSVPCDAAANLVPETPEREVTPALVTTPRPSVEVTRDPAAASAPETPTRQITHALVTTSRRTVTRDPAAASASETPRRQIVPALVNTPRSSVTSDPAAASAPKTPRRPRPSLSSDTAAHSAPQKQPSLAPEKTTRASRSRSMTAPSTTRPANTRLLRQTNTRL
ncbi:hypothetical protein O0L34_g4639 [Tuta absoluta]|nr:hypothetical protein O0L34_g4639 [Tuta absoluta]